MGRSLNSDTLVGLLLLALMGQSGWALPDPPDNQTPKASTPSPKEVVPLGLKEVQNKALSSSPVMKEQRSKNVEARYKVDEAYVPAYPTLNFQGGYTHLDPTQSVLLGTRALEVVTEHNYNFALSLRQAIFTFGRLQWAAASAELGVKAAQAEQSYQQSRVLEEATVAYYEAQQALAQREIGQKNLQARQAHLATAQSLLKNGSAARFDVKRDEAALASAQQALLEAENRVDLSRVKLGVLMGEAISSRPLEGEETDLAAPPADSGPSDAILEQRPDLSAMRFAQEAAQARVHLAEAGNNPSFNLQSDFTQRNAVGLSPGQQWSVGVQLAIPLYDGGLTEAKVGQAKAVAEQLQALYENALRQAKLEHDSLFLDLKNRYSRIEAANKGLEAAREAARISRLRYQNGYSTNVELLDSEAALVQAETDCVTARFQYRISWARYRRARGGL